MARKKATRRSARATVLGLPELLANALVVEPDDRDADVVADELASRLRGRKLPVDDPNGAHVAYGFRGEAMTGLRDAMTRPNAGPLDVVQLSQVVFSLLTAPARALPAPDAADGRRSVTLIGAFIPVGSESPLVAVGHLSEAALGGRHDLEVSVVEADAAVDILADAYRPVAATLSVYRSSGRVMWVGGPGPELEDRSGWRDRIVAVLAALGWEVEVLERPYAALAGVESRLKGVDAALVVFWSCDPATKAVSVPVTQAARNPVFETLERRLEDALLEAAWHLDEIEPAESEPPGELVTRLTPPVSGDVRYYRKRTSVAGGGPADPLRRVEDCGKNAWASANKADKAMNGVIKLEGGIRPKRLEHCAKCKGGGHWRATF